MSDKQMVIVIAGENCDAYAGTYEVAKQIFDSYISNLDNDVISIASSYDDDSKVKYVYSGVIYKTLHEIYTLDVRQPAVKYSRNVLGLKDKEQTVPVTEAMKTELAVWMLKHKLAERDLSSMSEATLARTKAMDLEMLKPLVESLNSTEKEIKFCAYDDYFEAARQYRVILNNKWKEDAKETAKIRYVLEFVNSYLLNARYDSPFELCELKNKF